MPCSVCGSACRFPFHASRVFVTCPCAFVFTVCFFAARRISPEVVDHLRDSQSGPKRGQGSPLSIETHLKRAFRDSTANLNVTMRGKQFARSKYCAQSGFIVQQARHVIYPFNCDVGSATVTCAARCRVCGVVCLFRPLSGMEEGAAQRHPQDS